MTTKQLINNVSDTALWVASYRAEESKRPDALFNDPYAQKLCGDKGNEIANYQHGSKYVKWSVILRTVIIDDFIKMLVNEKKIDMKTIELISKIHLKLKELYNNFKNDNLLLNICKQLFLLQ